MIRTMFGRDEPDNLADDVAAIRDLDILTGRVRWDHVRRNSAPPCPKYAIRHLKYAEPECAKREEAPTLSPKRQIATCALIRTTRILGSFVWVPSTEVSEMSRVVCSMRAPVISIGFLSFIR